MHPEPQTSMFLVHWLNTVNLKSASLVVVMLLHEGLSWLRYGEFHFKLKRVCGLQKHESQSFLLVIKFYIFYKKQRV